jgi:hypothetical protein
MEKIPNKFFISYYILVAASIALPRRNSTHALKITAVIMKVNNKNERGFRAVSASL